MRIFYGVDAKTIHYQDIDSSLYTEFKKSFPDLDLTEQYIVYRRNAIIKKGYLTTAEFDEVHREVGYELHQAGLITEEGSDEFQNVSNSRIFPTRCEAGNEVILT